MHRASIADQISGLALEMRDSTDFPRLARAAENVIRSTGLDPCGIEVALSRPGQCELLYCILLPAPVTWLEGMTMGTPQEEVFTSQRARQWQDPDDGEGSPWHVSLPTSTGVVTLSASREEPFLAEEVEILRGAALPLVMLVTRCADLTSLEQARAKIDKMDADLMALHDGSYDLSGDSQEQVCRKIIAMTTDKLDFDRAGVFLLDDEEQQLRGVVGIDEDGDTVGIAQTVFPLYPTSLEDLSEAAEIARGDLPYFLTQDLDGEGHESAEGDIRANAEVPMCSGGNIVGVLSVDNYFSDRPIHSGQLQSLMILANLGATAIYNMRLTKELKATKDQLEIRVDERTAELARSLRRLRQEVASRRRAQSAQQRVQQRLEQIVSLSPAVIYSCDVSSGFPMSFVSENVAIMLGYQPEEFIATSDFWPTRIHPDDADAVFTQTSSLLQSKSSVCEYRFLHRDGSYRWLHDEALLIRGHEDQKTVIIGSWLDITERRQAEEAQAAAEKELELQRASSVRADRLRSLGEMAAGIAHELNQPLVGVRGVAEHILLSVDRGWSQSREKLRERAATIVAQADRMEHIIEHVRMFSREAGKPATTTVQVNDAVRAAADMFRSQFINHGIDLIVHLAPDLPLIRANVFSLEEVLFNLLSNARDAVEIKSPDAGGDRRVKVQTSISTQGMTTHVRIDVTDTGVGVALKDQKRAFEPFFTTKGPDKGTGLGLSVSRAIVEEFGGRIWMKSQPAQGTTMTVILPVGGESGD